MFLFICFMYSLLSLFFFFKQKTAYEMRISDWSSDVCSSDLDRALVRYLEQLCTRAYFQIYGVQTSGWRQLRDFVAQGWPDAIAGLARDALAALVLTVLGTILGYLLDRHDAGQVYDSTPNCLHADRKHPV